MENEMNFSELQQIVSVCLDEIINLKEENEQLKKQVAALQTNITDIANSQRTYVTKNEEIMNNVYRRLVIVDMAIENQKYELNDPKMNRDYMYYPQFYEIEDTINQIINNRASMARFGDGEFAIMSNKLRQKFQRLDPKLASRLKEVINAREEGFLVGIADNYGDLSKFNEGGKRGVRYYMTDEVRKDHAEYLDLSRTYHNAYISRPYAMYADNNTDGPRKRFDALKRIWNGRDVIFVEGAETRLGVGNDLFDNAKTIRRIVAPATSSFDKYDEILAASLKYGNKGDLFLVALGPSAGVLAYDLYKQGFQALDVGHIDLEYEYFKGGQGVRCEVKHKYNNEFPGGDVVEEIHDETYEKQILVKIV